MANQQYVDYIKDNMASYPVDSLKQQLLNSGVTENEANEAVLLATKKEDITKGDNTQNTPILQPEKIQPETEETKDSVNLITGSKYFKLLLTDKRIIIANMGGTMGWFFWLGWIGLLISSSLINKKSKEFETLTPESVLKSDKHNFEIPFSSINSVELKKPGFFSGGKLIVHYMDSTRKDFNFQDKIQYQKGAEIFKKYLPEKLKQ